MNTQFDIEKVLNSGKIRNELEYERALIADRKLRILCNQNTKLMPLRLNLRDLIESYEKQYWSNETTITETKIRESDLAELIAEKERQFIQKRKGLIKKQLNEYGVNQQQLMLILGHKSKTYMSELMNGISPFTLNDLVIINRLFKIDLADLIPTTITQTQRARIKKSIQELGTNKIKLSTEDFDLVSV